MRMIRQVSKLGVFIAFFPGLAGYLCFTFFKVTAKLWISVFKYLTACFYQLLGFSNILMKHPNVPNSHIKAINLIKNSLVKKEVNTFLSLQKSALIFGFSIFFLSFFLLILFWLFKGKKDRRSVNISGKNVVPSKKMRRLILNNNEASNIEISNVPLIKGTETQHLLLTGTTGSGKSTCLHNLIDSIGSNKTLIFDATGEFIDRHFQEGDIILNPFDKRSAKWNMWAECSQAFHYNDLAEYFIPQTNSDPFWVNSARILFSELLELTATTKSIKYLTKLLFKMPLKDLFKVLKDTKAGPLVDPSADKTASSIRAQLSSSLSCLEYLEETDNPFSLRKWIQDDTKKNKVFLLMLPEQRAILRPLISAWLSIAMKSLLGCIPSQERKVWFVIDEIASLYSFKEIETFLAEGRKYGGCCVISTQNLSQIESLYGPNITKSIIDLSLTKILFQCSEYENAQRISKLLGQKEIRIKHEGISYGAHEMRDGVSLSTQERIEYVVKPTELLELAPLEAYLSLPKNYGVTKIKIERNKSNNIY